MASVELSELERAALIGLIVDHMTGHLEGHSSLGCDVETDDLLWSVAEKIGESPDTVRRKLLGLAAMVDRG